MTQNEVVFAGSRVITPAGLGWRLARPPSAPDAGAVLRSLVGVLAIAAVAVHWGAGATGMWATGAAAIAGAVALQDSPGGRVRLVTVVSLGLGAAVLVAAFTAPYGAFFVAVVAVWSFGAGMLWALGAHAGLVAAGATALLVVAPPVGLALEQVAFATAVTVAAGLIQAALIAVWPPRRWRIRRDALTRVYRTLGATARQLAEDPAAPVDPAPLTWLREAFADSEASQRPRAYQGGYRLPERINSTLCALREAVHGEPSAEMSALLTAAAEFLETLAGHGRTARADSEAALARVAAAAETLSGAELAVAQRFSRLLSEASALRFGRFAPPDLISSATAAVESIRAHFTWTSPVLRHAIRIAVATGLATAAARYGGVEQGHWMALTVLLVLRPETAHTYTRCAGRIAGIAAGIAVVALLTSMWQPAGLAAAACTAVFVGMSYAASRFGYVMVSATLAAAIEFMVGIDGGAGGAGLADRLFAVVIGGALAVIAHVVLPDHALVRLRHRAGELLKTEIDYAAMVIRAFVHELDHPADALSAAWQRAFRARAAFEAASGATRMESRELRRWLRSYRAALNAVTASCTSLERNLSAPPAESLSGEFVAAVDDYVDTLRGGPPSPATPWTIDADELAVAHEQLREVASGLTAEASSRVLVAEVGTITRQLLSIAAGAPD